MKDIDYRPPGARQVGDAELRELRVGAKASEHHYRGAEGAGKTYPACALAHRACREGMTAFYLRAQKLYHALAMSRANGSYARVLAKSPGTAVLVLDDLGLAALTHSERLHPEIIEDRHGSATTIIASQLSIEHWHEVIGDPTIADALLDRLCVQRPQDHLEGRVHEKEKGIVDTKGRTNVR